MGIIVNNLSYVHPDREELFSGVSFSIADGERASIVGDNGAGKSTLLKIVAGRLPAAAGSVAADSPLWFVPQHFGQYDSMTVAQALGIDAKLAALGEILAGSTSELHYTALADDWGIRERARAALIDWNIGHVTLSQPMAGLSGGEKTKVFLAGTQLNDPDVILMDEPNNHLDAASRESLYRLVERSRATTLIVSHDRDLLNRMETTFELTSDGMVLYGGNYDFYKSVRDSRRNALLEQIGEKEKALRAAQQKARETMERQQRSDARGKGKMKKEGVPRIMLKTIADGAAATARKQGEAHSEKIGHLQKETQELRARLAPEGRMKLAFDDADLHAGKIMVRAESINFAYSGMEPLWPEPLSLLIRSGERIAITGPNGSGKTTLLKILLGELEPTAGTIRRSGTSYVWIDQEYSLIEDSLTVLGQLESYNVRNLPDHFLKTELHRFLFPAGVWDRPCSRLSGGEKMRLMLCCLQVANDAPDIFVLDEPTNNLDIRSMEILTSAIAGYSGTVLVISHDSVFLKEIGAERTIGLKPRSAQD